LAIAEPIVLLTGLFTVLVWLLSLPNPPFHTLLVFSTFIPVIPSVAVVSFAIWIYRNRVSNRALVRSVALGCYSWLQVAFGFGGIFGFVMILFPVMVCRFTGSTPVQSGDALSTINYSRLPGF
jgi:hypothetical protein